MFLSRIRALTVNTWGHDSITVMSQTSHTVMSSLWYHIDATITSQCKASHRDNTVTLHWCSHIISVNSARVTHMRASWSSKLHGRIHLSYFKTDTDYSRRNIIYQGIEGCWIWDIVYWISLKKPVLWVSDNTSNLEKTVRDCVKLLWCHSVKIVWAYCDVTVWGHCDAMLWDIGEAITVMSLGGECDVSIWGHCELIDLLWLLHEVCVRSLGCHGDLTSTMVALPGLLWICDIIV